MCIVLERIFSGRSWGLYVVAVVFITGVANADEFPLWEAGVGLGAISLPDYRGSNERTFYALPIPYLIYRGDILRIDRNSTRGLLFKTEQVELDLSLNAAPPVNSKKNKAREGMPDLDPTGEIGPSLNVKYGESPLLRGALSIQLPFRIVAATDLTYIRQVGYVFNPRINIDWHLGESTNRWNAGFTAGPLFTDKKFNAYYYAVDPAYATPARPSYTVRGGYGGFQMTATLSRRFESLWFGAFVRSDDLHKAVFADSPLVKTPYSVMFGFAVSWVIDKSSATVTRDE